MTYGVDPMMVGMSGAVYVVPAAGGAPKRLGAQLFSVANPVWSPDSKHLLAFVKPRTGFAWSETDWWLFATDGAAARPTGDLQILKQQGFSLGFDRMPRLSEWTKRSVVFAAGFGDAMNIWRAPVSSEGHITGPAKRLTSGTTLEISPTLAPNGELAFSSLNRTLAVWSLPADTEQGKAAGDPKMITAGPADVLPSISSDGRVLAFTAARKKLRGYERRSPAEGVRPSGPVTFSEEAADLQVRTKDLSTGKETVFSGDGAAQWHPQVSRDGSMVAYTSGAVGRLYIARANGESQRMILGGKSAYPWDWSRDNRLLLFNSFEGGIHSVDVQSGREKPFLDRPGFALHQVKFSPDDQSLAVLGCDSDASGAPQCQIFIVPMENGAPARAERWIAIDHPSHWDDKPRWSPKGDLIYFISDRDGYLCLWAQRFARSRRALVGAPMPVYHFHNARLSMANVDMGILEIDVAKDKIVMGLGDLTGNIWSVRRRPRS
jgi:Tol biopolymer transport system component